MGYTNHTFSLITPLIAQHNIKSVLDLGAQNNYTDPQAPYCRAWYTDQGIGYTSIDLSAEDGAFPYDLAKPIDDILGQFDMLVDAGTSEHIGTDGKHDMKAIYQCWKTKHELLKAGGFMVCENPKSGSWPLHGFNYYTKSFYMRLTTKCGYRMLDLGEHAAMGNTTDGWNVHCVLQKLTDTPFITFEQFKDCKIELK